MTEVLDSFGAWIRQRRSELGLSRPELAKCATCSVSALRKIEADERRPSRQLAQLLALCLRISPEYENKFIDAARGVRMVANLGTPSLHPPISPEVARPLTTGAVALSAATPPPWRIPAPATPLIGREVEVATIGQFLDDPACRLLTLTGPGGIGKTRLALEAACFTWDRFADGVFFAPLEATSSEEFMATAIAHALGLNFGGTGDPVQQLVNFLTHKQVLLLLDNLEHLLEGAGLLVEIMASAPQVKLLVTSRERLNLRGEWVFEVQGLPVQDEGHAHDVQTSSAVQLFLQRARQGQAGFEPTDEEMRQVVRICRLVEGMPLAIELAATWVVVLSCQEILHELERGLEILSTLARDVPERQRSMRAVFDYSWRMLADEERLVLRRLSVFRGGFQREAAQTVAGADLTLLSSLQAQSFIRRTSSGRLTMHELIRQYLAGHLQSDPEEETAALDRHSAYYVEFVARLEEKLKGAQQLEALADIDGEIDNVRLAWLRAVQQINLTAVKRPIRALWYSYDIRGRFREAEAGLGILAETLEALPIDHEKSEPAVDFLAAYARALQGWFCLRLGKLDESQRLLKPSLAFLRHSGISVELGDVLYYAGTVAWMTGDYQEARACYLQELLVAEQVGDEWDIGLANGNLGLLAQIIGEYEEAQQRWQTAVAIMRRLGDVRTLAAGLHFSGILKRIVGAKFEAQANFKESLALSTAAGDRWIYGMALSQLGEVTRELGNNAEAVRLLDEGVALLQELGEHWSTLQALIALGAATAANGDFAKSRTAYFEALTTAWNRQAIAEVLAALLGLAQLNVHSDSRDDSLPAALTSTLFVLHHPSTTQNTRDEASQFGAEIKARMAAADLEAAQAAVQKLTLETLVSGILSPIPTHQA